MRISVLFLHSSSPHKLTLKAVSHAISAAVTSEKKTEDVKLRVRWLSSVYLSSYRCQFLMVEGDCVPQQIACFHAWCSSVCCIPHLKELVFWAFSKLLANICLNESFGSLILMGNWPKLWAKVKSEGRENLLTFDPKPCAVQLILMLFSWAEQASFLSVWSS